MTPAQLRAWRERAKWTQTQAAEQFRVHLRTYRRWETTGPVPPWVVTWALPALDTLVAHA